MKISTVSALTAGLWLFACGPNVNVQPPQTVDLAAEAVHLDGAGPPPGPEGACWAHDVIPAKFETVTDQTLVTPEVRDAGGNVTTPATYRTVSKAKMVQDRRDVWFQTPCPPDVTVDFVATLQRALLARGYYSLPLTGVMDAATTEAVRHYQADHGLDSAILSLGATKQLGLVTTALGDLK